MSDTTASTQDQQPEPVKVGSYDKLSKQDKAIVDSIILTQGIDQARLAENDPTTATAEQILWSSMLRAAQDPSKPTGYPTASLYIESSIEIARDVYAVDRDLIKHVRQTLREQGLQKSDFAKFTQLAGSLIELDGDQFNVQRDLPNVVSPDSPALRK